MPFLLLTRHKTPRVCSIRVLSLRVQANPFSFAKDLIVMATRPSECRPRLRYLASDKDRLGWKNPTPPHLGRQWPCWPVSGQFRDLERRNSVYIYRPLRGRWIGGLDEAGQSDMTSSRSYLHECHLCESRLTSNITFLTAFWA